MGDDENSRLTERPAPAMGSRTMTHAPRPIAPRLAAAAAAAYGYSVELRPVGDEDPEVGPPTQMAVFRRDQSAEVGA